jgi:hypothetical protein
MAQISFCVNQRNLRIEVGADGGGAGFGFLIFLPRNTRTTRK